MKIIILTALLTLIAAAQTTVQTFVQGPTEVKISSVPVFADGEVLTFNQMVCARSHDGGVADLRIKGEITLSSFEVLRFDQLFVRNTATWKHPTCQIVATTALPALQVTGLEVIPSRADPMIVFIPLPTGTR